MGASTPCLERFAQLLVERAIPLGYLGPHEDARIVERHVGEAAGLSTLLPQWGITLDVGSGAGLPGIPLACIRTDPVVLLDAQARRVQFLREVRTALDLERVEVVQGRAEDLGHTADLRERMDVVVARALAAPCVAVELTLPFARPGGIVCLVAGDADVASDPDLSAAVDQLGGASVAAEPYEVPGVAEPRWAMMIEKERATPDAYPRRAGVPARRPLGRERDDV